MLGCLAWLLGPVGPVGYCERVIGRLEEALIQNIPSSFLTAPAAPLPLHLPDRARYRRTARPRRCTAARIHTPAMCGRLDCCCVRCCLGACVMSRTTRRGCRGWRCCRRVLPLGREGEEARRELPEAGAPVLEETETCCPHPLRCPHFLRCPHPLCQKGPKHVSCVARARTKCVAQRATLMHAVCNAGRPSGGGGVRRAAKKGGMEPRALRETRGLRPWGTAMHGTGKGGVPSWPRLTRRRAGGGGEHLRVFVYVRPTGVGWRSMDK